MALNETFTQEAVGEIFVYLDELRESGETNMNGAGAYVMREFCMLKSSANAVVAAWMKTFSYDFSPHQRAADAYKTL